MELATDIPGEHATNSTASSPNSIIDRKRELKAIPGSFSYNLGHRGSGLPPRLDTSLDHSPSRSVKSIVAWIESSAASKRSSRLSTSDDGATLRSNASSYKLLGSLEASPSRQLDPGTISAGVDCDCPTFLDYQQYFSQGSLARCLDEQYVTAVSPTKDADADVTMLGKKRLQNRKCEILAENEEGTVGEARSHAEVAAL
ncbi:hypothetical protein LMH87_011759 [Akanthomyces muscarius]|uniref:Uncharacterized protein n=1 Tax=Akanthomyces muscarius TaxID=2231603 RepID=A0A9W8UL38_AKAMU|nr:hypothetical protein LMH87_011759 [Akanthomyces muscarius]KAJ4151039.1 hypothetical protein LMH87_011759 [Akanthomyces muscarius]